MQSVQPVGRESLGVNRLRRTKHTDSNLHGLPLLKLELPELFSLSKSTRRSLAKKLPLAGKDLEILYKMEQEWGKKDFHQSYMAQWD